MTAPDTPHDMTPDILAGEYVLGIVEGAELAEARRLMLSDPAFRDAVEYWESRLSTLATGESGLAPSDSAWAGIEARINADGDDDTVVVSSLSSGGATMWKLAAAVSTAMLSGLAMLMFFQPSNDAPAPGTQGPIATPSQLIAQLSGEADGRSVTTRIDPSSNRIALKVAGLGTGLADGSAPELWVIPASGTPRSMGLIPAEGVHSRTLTREEAALLAEGATLAVTYEARDSAPHTGPTSDIVVAGTVVRI